MSITLAELKKALKIDYSTDDSELLRLKDAAIAWIQNYTGQSLEPMKKKQYISYWMKTRLDAYPFLSVDSVKYTNTSGTITTMPTTDYFIDPTCPPSTYINFSEFPFTKENTFIEITYTAGYADTPKDIEQVIIAFVGAWYNQPEAISQTSQVTVPTSAQYILDNLKVRSVLE